MVAGPDALAGQEVGQAVGPLLHLGEGAALARGHQVLAVPEGVHRRLEQISQVERHRPVSRTRFYWGGKQPRDANTGAPGTCSSGSPALSPALSGLRPALGAGAVGVQSCTRPRLHHESQSVVSWALIVAGRGARRTRPVGGPARAGSAQPAPMSATPRSTPPRP